MSAAHEQDERFCGCCGHRTTVGLYPVCTACRKHELPLPVTGWETSYYAQMNDMCPRQRKGTEDE